MSRFNLDTPANAVAKAILSDPDGSKDGLRDLGFRDPDRAVLNLRAILQPEGSSSLPADLFRELAGVPDPDMALNNLDRLSHAAPNRSALFRSLRDFPSARGRLLFLLGASQFLTDILIRDPEYLHAFSETPERITSRRTVQDLSREFAGALEAFPTFETKLDALKQMARRES